MKHSPYKIAVLAAALLIVGAGCSKAADTDEPASGQQAVKQEPQGDVVAVTYNPAGLDKKDVTIKVGDWIEFRNSDLKAHWPASNPHPSHTDYPEFDPQAAVKPGDTWRFRFMKAGDWKFHDHMSGRDAKVQGVIHVK